MTKTTRNYTRVFRGISGLSRSVLMVMTMACVSSPINAIQNLALGKSSYHTDTGYNGYPGKAVDGNTNGYFQHGSCQHTYSTYNAWWKVDLGKVYVIDHVTVYNRLECCGDRLKHVQVFIGLHDEYYTEHGYHAGYGRWVKITRVPGTEYHQLSLCEVQVMGNELSQHVVKYRRSGGMIGTGVPLDSSPANSKLACCVQCKTTSSCVAVNYNSDTGLCEKLQTVATTSDSDENKYFYRLN